MSQDTQYTAMLHMRCSVMWCLRYGVIVCCVCCVCVVCLCVIHGGCIRGGGSVHIPHHPALVVDAAHRARPRSIPLGLPGVDLSAAAVFEDLNRILNRDMPKFISSARALLALSNHIRKIRKLEIAYGN